MLFCLQKFIVRNLKFLIKLSKSGTNKIEFTIYTIWYVWYIKLFILKIFKLYFLLYNGELLYYDFNNKIYNLWIKIK